MWTKYLQKAETPAGKPRPRPQTQLPWSPHLPNKQPYGNHPATRHAFADSKKMEPYTPVDCHTTRTSGQSTKSCKIVSLPLMVPTSRTTQRRQWPTKPNLPSCQNLRSTSTLESTNQRDTKRIQSFALPMLSELGLLQLALTPPQ